MRLLEALEPLGDRRVGNAERLVLALVPGGADAQERPAAGQHVERGDGLREQAGVPVGDAGDEQAELHPLGLRRDEVQHRVALEHRVERGLEVLHLEPVVHRGEPDDARLVGGDRRVTDRRAQGGPAVGVREVHEVDAKLHSLYPSLYGDIGFSRAGRRHEWTLGSSGEREGSTGFNYPTERRAGRPSGSRTCCYQGREAPWDPVQPRRATAARVSSSVDRRSPPGRSPRPLSRTGAWFSPPPRVTGRLGSPCPAWGRIMRDVGSLLEAAPGSRAAVLEERYRSRLPETLDDLAGPGTGTVQLPRISPGLA